MSVPRALIAGADTSTAAIQLSEFSLLAVFIAAGAEPLRLAHWLCQNTDTHLTAATLGALGPAVQRQINRPVSGVLERGMPASSKPDAAPPTSGE